MNPYNNGTIQQQHSSHIKTWQQQQQQQPMSQDPEISSKDRHSDSQVVRPTEGWGSLQMMTLQRGHVVQLCRRWTRNRNEWQTGCPGTFSNAWTCSKNSGRGDMKLWRSKVWRGTPRKYVDDWSVRRSYVYRVVAHNRIFLLCSCLRRTNVVYKVKARSFLHPSNNPTLRIRRRDIMLPELHMCSGVESVDKLRLGYVATNT